MVKKNQINDNWRSLLLIQKWKNHECQEIHNDCHVVNNFKYTMEVKTLREIKASQTRIQQPPKLWRPRFHKVAGFTLFSGVT